MHSSRRRRAQALVLAAALSLAGCTFSVTTGSPDVLPSSDQPPPAIGPPDDASSSAPASLEPSGPTTGTLEIMVLDTRGRARSDVVVRYRGPARGRVVTGPAGLARVAVPPGSYSITVPARCSGELEVFYGPTLNAQVYAGARSVARLRNLDARRRFWPSTPIEWSADPPWRTGRAVTLSFLVYDRCTGEAASPGSSIRDLRFEPNRYVQVLEAPGARSDGSARASLRFRCVAEGPGAVNALDPDTGERIDVLALKPPIAPIDELCV